MPISELKLIRRSAEFQNQKDVELIPHNTRGIYVLYQARKVKSRMRYDVVYVGMARGTKSGVRGRLKTHLRSPKKKNKWSHFSIFEVWDNITSEEVAELEGLFRHIYRKDMLANSLNIQRGFKKLKKIAKNLDDWE